MYIVYPHDPSTKFLSHIIEEIELKLIKTKIDRALPDKFEETKNNISQMQNSDTFIFLGHGSSFGLSGGCYSVQGRETLISQADAQIVFQKKKLILLSCRSGEFLRSLNNVFNSAIGFGNIITGNEDLNGRKEKEKFRDFKSIDIFRNKLTSVFVNALIEAYIHEYTFFQMFNALRLRINKAISKYSFSKNVNERLAGELMFDLKKNMVLIGNPNTFINK